MGKKAEELSSGHILRTWNIRIKDFSVHSKFSPIAVCTVALRRRAEKLKAIIVCSRKRTKI